MPKILIKHFPKLVVTAIAGCAVCCAPLILPLIAGGIGIGAFGGGLWAFAGLFVLAAVLFVVRRKAKTCSCVGQVGCGRCET